MKNSAIRRAWATTIDMCLFVSVVIVLPLTIGAVVLYLLVDLYPHTKAQRLEATLQVERRLVLEYQYYRDVAHNNWIGCLNQPTDVVSTYNLYRQDSGTPMPREPRWWEKKEPCPLARALMQHSKMRKFHALLGQRIKKLRGCVPGTKACFRRWLDMYEAVDLHIQDELLQTHLLPPREASWITVTMMAEGNLERLYAFLGRQLRARADRLAAVDRYLKRAVLQHGGPLIDRDWNKR